MKKNPALEGDLESVYTACRELGNSIARLDRIASRISDEGLHKRMKETVRKVEAERKSLAVTAGTIEGVYKRGWYNA